MVAMADAMKWPRSIQWSALAPARGRSMRPMGWLVLLFLLSCSTNQPPQSHQFYVFGTLVNVTVATPDAAIEAQVVNDIHAQFRRMHGDLHAWKPGPLVTLNRCLISGQWCEVDASTRELIRQAQQLSARSDGLFDPGIGALVSLWGFHTDEYPIVDPPPPAEEVTRLIASSPSIDSIEFDNRGRARSHSAATQLDFGGFAKGIAVDWAVETARQAGVNGLIANAGGDLRAIGTNGKQPWRVAIRRAFGEGHLGGIIVDGDDAIFTSGVYQRYRAFDGQRYPHLIDPRTGMPVTDLLSATVIANTGALADAAATALVIAGPSSWREMATRLGIDEALVVTEDGSVLATQAMVDRLIDVPDDITIEVVE